MNETDFGWALVKLRGGLKITRTGWNGKGAWVALQTPTDTSKMSMPYIYMKTTAGELIPWTASQTDLLATDWSTVQD